MKSPFLPALIAAAALYLPAVAAAQSRRVADLKIGKLLVAPRESPDPNFAHSVVLLVEFDKDGAVGLLINHPTHLPISRVLEQLKSAKKRSDPVYLGGPVDMEVVMGLLKAEKKAGEARPVLPNVYLVSTRPLLEKTLATGPGPGEFHAYVGYCGWSPGQLEYETRLGAWYIFEGNSELVFASDPASIWERLVAQTESRYARALPAIEQFAVPKPE